MNEPQPKAWRSYTPPLPTFRIEPDSYESFTDHASAAREQWLEHRCKCGSPYMLPANVAARGCAVCCRMAPPPPSARSSATADEGGRNG